MENDFFEVRNNDRAIGMGEMYVTIALIGIDINTGILSRTEMRIRLVKSDKICTSSVYLVLYLCCRIDLFDRVIPFDAFPCSFFNLFVQLQSSGIFKKGVLTVISVQARQRIGCMSLRHAMYSRHPRLPSWTCIEPLPPE